MLNGIPSRPRGNRRRLTGTLLGTCLACVLAGTAQAVDAAGDDETAPSSAPTAAQPKLKLKLSKPPIAAPQTDVHIKPKATDKLRRSKAPARRHVLPKPPTRATDTAPPARPKAEPRLTAPRRAPHRRSRAAGSRTPPATVPRTPPTRIHAPPRARSAPPAAGLKAPARKPSGAHARRGGFAPRTATSRPKYDAATDAFQFPDGTRVRAKGPDGQRGRVNDKGDIEYGDGTIITHDSASGETDVIRPDGSHTTYGHGGGASPMASRPKYNSRTDRFEFADGTQVRSRGPDGERGKVNDKGDIVYADGTIITHDDATGETNVIRPDGSHTSYGRGSGGGSPMAGRPKYDSATGTYEYPDGTRVAGTDPKGRRGRVTDKGDIYYKDGTMVTHDGASGDTTVIRPDGSSSTYHGDGSRTDRDARTGVTAHFGARDSRTEYGSSKDKDTDSKDDSGGGSSSSGGSADTGGRDTSSSSSDDGKDSDSSSDSGDDDGKDSDSSSDSGGDGKDSDSGKDDGGKDEGGDAEKLYGGSGTAGPGSGPTAAVRDKLERLRNGRDRDEEGGGESRCGPMSRPGPDGRCQESVGASRSSAEPAQPIMPFDTRPRATRGKGLGPDCFDPAGCNGVADVPARTSPMDRRPVTDPSPE